MVWGGSSLSAAAPPQLQAARAERHPERGELKITKKQLSVTIYRVSGAQSRVRTEGLSFAVSDCLELESLYTINSLGCRCFLSFDGLVQECCAVDLGFETSSH